MKRTLIVIASLILPAVVLAAGIEVSPEKLEFELTGGKAKTEEITVANPTADVQLFEVYPDDFTQAIKANPESFTLEAGGRKKVLITLDPRRISGAAISTNISVLGKPLAESGVRVNTGVKIPVSARIAKSRRSNFASLAVSALIIAGVGVFLFWKRSRRLKAEKPPSERQ